MRLSKKTALRVLPYLLGVAAFIAVSVLVRSVFDHVYRSDVAGSERPSDDALIKTFVSHRTELDQARCELRSSEGARNRLSIIGVQFASCDYDNTLRLGFDGSRLGFAVGPGWEKGLTHIPGGLGRKGMLVGSTDGKYRSDADVYLRPLGNGWFIWFQRDE